MKIIKSILAILLFAIMAMQGASAAEPEPPGGFFEKMDSAVRTVGVKAGRDLGKTLSSAGYNVAKTVSTTALGIAGALGVLYLLYEVMQFLSGKTKSMLTVLFDVGIPCIFAALFITQYPRLLPMFEGFLDVFRNLGTNVAGGGQDPFTGILNVYTTVIDRVTESIGTAFKQTTAAVGFFEKPSKLMLALIDLLLTVLFALAILVLLLIGVAEVLGLLLIGPFLFAVGVAFGPIMIAGLVTPWTRDYFTKWLQFLVISAGLTGVINVIFTIAKQLMDAVKPGEATGEPTAVALVIIAILILTINSMISQAPSIASALFPGHVGVSKSTGQAAATAAKKAAAGTKNTVAGGVKGTAATINGGIKGGRMAFAFAKSKLPGKSTP